MLRRRSRSSSEPMSSGAGGGPKEFLQSVQSAGISDLLPSGRMRTNCKPPGMPKDLERLSFEGVMRTRDGHPFRKVLRVGSVWWFPSIRFRTKSGSSSWRNESPMRECCA